MAGAGDDAAEKEVDVVGFAGAEGAGEFVAGEGGDGGDVEGVAVAGGVEGDVCLDVFCELDWRREVLVVSSRVCVIVML